MFHDKKKLGKKKSRKKQQNGLIELYGNKETKKNPKPPKR